MESVFHNMQVGEYNQVFGLIYDHEQGHFGVQLTTHEAGVPVKAKNQTKPDWNHFTIRSW